MLIQHRRSTGQFSDPAITYSYHMIVLGLKRHLSVVNALRYVLLVSGAFVSIGVDSCWYSITFVYGCIGPQDEVGAHIYPGGLGSSGLSWLSAHWLGLS